MQSSKYLAFHSESNDLADDLGPGFSSKRDFVEVKPYSSGIEEGIPVNTAEAEKKSNALLWTAVGGCILVVYLVSSLIISAENK